MGKDRVTQMRGRRGNVTGHKGSEAGKEAKYDKIAEDAERQTYRQKHGAGGLGGARKANDPKFKAGEDAHIRKWREARAKAAGRQKAAKKLGEKKPE